MNIEESIEYLKLKIKNDNLTIQGMFGDIYEEIQKDNKAIETLLTAYEKEKEKNKKARDMIEYYLIENNLLNDFDKRNKELRKLEKVLEE